MNSGLDERDGFYFHRSFWEAVNELPQKDQLPILRAIILFGLFGEEPEKLSPMQKGFYLLVRPILQKGRNKAANGKKGGSKKEANGKQTESKKEGASPLPLSDKGLGSNPYGLRQGTSDKGVNEPAAPAPAPAEGKAFTSFWEAYPCKIGRESAWEAWTQLRPDVETVSRIMEGLEGWKESENWEEAGGKFIPRAAKFLTEKHWESPPAPKPYLAGGKRQYDEWEIRAIQRMMAEDPEPERQLNEDEIVAIHRMMEVEP